MKNAMRDFEAHVEASLTRSADCLRRSIYLAMVVQGLAIAIGVAVAVLALR